MKFLVTGASGFLGEWLTKYLVQQGHEVHILQRQESNVQSLEGLPVVSHIGDVTNYASLEAAFSGMDAVFHLAGLIAYRKSERSAMERVNVHGTENVIKACQYNQVKRLVHLSSVVAVGAGFKPTDILTEDSPYNLSHLNLGYFETKRKAEVLVMDACRDQKLDAVILNPTTIYGPGDAKKGSRNIQLKVARGKFPFYPPGGVNVVHVEDVVQAVYSAWEKGKCGERYILAGENILIKDLFRMIAECAGQNPPKYPLPTWLLFVIGYWGDFLQKFGKKPSLSVENAWVSCLFHWFDSKKAKQELGFKPRPSIEAIRASVNWLKQNGLLKN